MCHATLWDVLDSNGNVGAMYRLFRYSSFLWRLRGDETKETEFLVKLKTISDRMSAAPEPRDAIERRYFWSRVRDVLAGLRSGPSGTQTESA
jgi:hypothetical protein